MSKRHLLILLTAISLCLQAQPQRQKLSAGTRSWLHQQGKGKAEAQTRGKGKARFLTAYVTLRDETDARELEARGAVVRIQRGNVVVADIPIDSLESIAASEAVTHIEKDKSLKARTAQTRKLTQADDVIAGTGLEQPYTGEGVIIGIIDTGIDYTHPIFKDTDGNSRIKAVYMPDDDTGKAPVIGKQRLPGSEYTTKEEIAELTCDTETQTHGTHTASIAGGTHTTYQSGRRTKKEYGGMAPGADFVLVGLGENMSDINVLYGIYYINEYAKQQGKPCVINMSLGSHYGPHNGKTYFNFMESELIDEYRNIHVVSAGNEGNSGMHLYHQLGANDSVCTLIGTYKAYMDEDSKGAYEGSVTVAYNRNGKEPLPCRFLVADTVAHQVVYATDILRKDTVFSTTPGDTNYHEELARYFKEDTDIEIYVEEEDYYSKQADTYVYIEGQLKEEYQHCLAGIVLYGEEGVEFDIWQAAPYNDALLSGGIEGFSTGDSDLSIQDNCVNQGNISVGAYIGQSYYPAADGNNWGSRYYTEGDYVHFTSYANALDGHDYPTIAAPGLFIVGAYSSADEDAYSPEDLSSYSFLQTDERTGKEYPWGPMSGTSMSAPAVTGIIALWKQAKPTLTVDEIKELFAATADQDDYTRKAPLRFGYGKINALEGIKRILTTGIRGIDVAQDQILITPSGATGGFSIYAQDEPGLHIEVIDMRGNMLYRQQADTRQHTVDLCLSHLRTGVYLLRVKGERASKSIKFVIP